MIYERSHWTSDRTVPSGSRIDTGYYDRRQTAQTTRGAVAHLERLGYRVTLEPAA